MIGTYPTQPPSQPDERTRIANDVDKLTQTREACAMAYIQLRALGWDYDKAKAVYREKGWEI